MHYLRLQRNLVRLCNDYYEHYQWCPTREELAYQFLIKQRWHNDLVLCRRVDDALGDCIEGRYKYIGYEDPARRERLKITLEGRDFITFMGYWQELFERRDKFAMFLLGFVAGIVIPILGWLIQIIFRLLL